MTALTVIPNNAAPPAVRHEMPELERMARAFAASGLFGAKTPEQALALCLVAQAEGKHPAIAAKTYHIINGNPSKKSEAMLADFLAAGGRVEWHALTDDVADATFSHPQGGSVRITWDAARVQQAQLGGNPMHKKYPRAMKRARCISEGVRTIYPGATGGMYATEEIQDGGIPIQMQAANPTPVLTGAALLEQASDHAPPAAEVSPGAGEPQHGAAAGAAPKEATLNWVAETLRQIAAADSIAALAELQASKAKGLARLEAFPKLRDDVLASFNDRRAVLDGGAGDDWAGA